MLPSPSTDQLDQWTKSVNGKHGPESYANKAGKASSPAKQFGSGSGNRVNYESKRKPTSDEEKHFFPPLFLFNKECPHQVSNLAICQAAADSLQFNGVVAAQRFGPLWHLFPKTMEIRAQLAGTFLTIGDKTDIEIFSKNPSELVNEFGQNLPSTKLTIELAPLRMQNSRIKEALLKEGIKPRGFLRYEVIYNSKNQKPTPWYSGKRFIYIDVPQQPLPRVIRIDDFDIKLFHREQKIEYSHDSHQGSLTNKGNPQQSQVDLTADSALNKDKTLPGKRSDPGERRVQRELFIGPLEWGDIRSVPMDHLPLFTFIGPLEDGEVRGFCEEFHPIASTMEVQKDMFIGPLEAGEIRGSPIDHILLDLFIGPLEEGKLRGFGFDSHPLELYEESSSQPEPAAHHQFLDNLFIGPLEEGEVRGSINEHLPLMDAISSVNIFDSSLPPQISPVNKVQTISSNITQENICQPTEVIIEKISSKTKVLSLHNATPPQNMDCLLQDPQAEQSMESASIPTTTEANPASQAPQQIQSHCGAGSESLPTRGINLSTMTGKNASLGEASANKVQHSLFIGSREEGLTGGEQKMLSQTKVTTNVDPKLAIDYQPVSHNLADSLDTIHSSNVNHVHSQLAKNNDSLKQKQTNKTKNVTCTNVLPPQALITSYIKQVPSMDNSPAPPVLDVSPANPPDVNISEIAHIHAAALPTVLGDAESSLTKGELASSSDDNSKAQKQGCAEGLINLDSKKLNAAPSSQPASGPAKVNEVPEEGELTYEEGEITDDEDTCSELASLIPLANTSSVNTKVKKGLAARVKSSPVPPLKKQSPKSKKGKRALYKTGIKTKQKSSSLLVSNDPSQTKIVDSFSPRSRSMINENNQARSRSGSLKSARRSPADVPTAKHSKREQATSNSQY